MSFTYRATGKKSDVAGELIAPATEALAQVDEARRPEAREMVFSVDEIVEELVWVVGRDEDEVTVSVSGHSNPGHAPAEGWGDEYLTITVSVARKG